MNTETSARVFHDTIEMERTYRASPARVFAAWKSVEARQRWSRPSPDVAMRAMLKATGFIFSLAILAACQTLDAPPLDDYTLTTANGVRFRTESGINNTCNTPDYSDSIGWGGYYVTVEQGGNVRKNAKFNFASPGQDWDNLAVGQARTLTILFADEYQWGCRQWQFAPEEAKAIYLNYFREAITLTFEAATRFEAAGRIGPDALKPEIVEMKEKFDKLWAQKPKKRYD